MRQQDFITCACSMQQFREEKSLKEKLVVAKRNDIGGSHVCDMVSETSWSQMSLLKQN